MVAVSYKETVLKYSSTAASPQALRLVFCDSEGQLSYGSGMLPDHKSLQERVSVWSEGLRPGKALRLPPNKKQAALTVVACVGSGSLEDLRLCAWQAVRGLRKEKKIAVVLPRFEKSSMSDDVGALVLGALLGTYKFESYLQGGHSKAPEFTWHGKGGTNEKKAIKQALVIADGNLYTRHLVDTPSNDKPPAVLARWAQSAARKVGVTCRVLDEKKMRQMGMNTLCGVGQGSVNPPRLVILEYSPLKGKTQRSKPIVFVGKGITYDSGGLALKPWQSMQSMRADMAGSAAVLGAILTIARLKLKVNVVVLMACAENMPDGKAYKPGDIIKSHHGYTVQIGSTDAEGRLVLCDALSYAREWDPQCIVDMATLTGAKMVALGPKYAAAMGNSPEINEEFRVLGEKCGDLVWPLPMPQEYRDKMKGTFSDLKNSSDRWASSITAGGFLSWFVDDYPWCHLDIAGSCSSFESERPMVGKGASGFGVSLLTAFAASRAGGQKV